MAGRELGRRNLLLFGAIGLGSLGLSYGIKKVWESLPNSLKSSPSISIKVVGFIAKCLSLSTEYKLLPSALVAIFYVKCQNLLQQHVHQLFASLPPTGLYQNNYNMFHNFCKNTLAIFETSPRGKKLRECEIAIKEKFK